MNNTANDGETIKAVGSEPAAGTVSTETEAGVASGGEEPAGSDAVSEQCGGEASGGEVDNKAAAKEPVDVKPSEEDQVEKARQETQRVRDQMLRIAADFDNFRKRSRREVDDAARRAREDFLRELLPVFDNLERAVGHAEQALDAKAVADGVKMVLKQFLDTLGKVGVRRIKSVGEPFDPNVHEAIQQVTTGDQAPGTVVAEVQPGYAWEDRLVRAAMVVVAKAPPAQEPKDSEQVD